MKLKYLIISVFLLIILLIIFIVNKEVVIYIGNEKVVLNNELIDFSIDLKTFNSEFDTIIKEKSFFDRIIVNGEEVNGEKNLGKLNITNSSVLEVEVEKLFGKKQKYIINLLPSTFPSYKVKGKSNYEGNYYTSTYSFNYDSDHYVFKMNEEGKIIFYKKTNMVAFDFQKQVNKHGEVRYLYLEAMDNNFDGLTSLLPCHLVILDENYNEIDRITHIKSNGKELKIENHGYIYLDDGHYILVAYEPITDKLNNEKLYVYNCVIQEIKNGEILWEFNSKDYKELYNYSTLEKLDYSKKYQDYIHFNSMSIDLKDDNLLCSFRNLDGLLKINRANGKLMWKFGGLGDEFNLTLNQKSSKQHSVLSLDNNKILLYDNGNGEARSRVLEYTLDEQNRKITNFKEYDLGLYASFMGSVRVIDEEKSIYLLCYGGGDYKKSTIQEINLETGEVYFEFVFTDIKNMYNVNKYR